MPNLRIIILLLCVQLATACTASNTAVESAPPPTTESEVIVSSQDADLAEPAMAAGADGSSYLVYVEHRLDKSSDVYIQRFEPTLKLTGQRVRVNKVEGEAKTWAGDPPTIAAAADGSVYVGWTRKVRSADGSGTDLMVSVSRDGGQTFGEPVKVNDDTLPASHGMHSLALGKNGEIYAAWLDERALRANTTVRTVHHSNKSEAEEPNSEVYFAVSRDGGKTFSKNRKIAVDVCPCCKTSMAVSPEGALYLSWRQVMPGSYRHIAVAASDDRGETFKPPVVVSDDKWQLYACPVSGAAMAAGQGGNLEVVWYAEGDAGPRGIYRAESNDGGQTFGPRVLIGPRAVSGSPTLARNHDSSAIYAFSESEGRIAIGAADQSVPSIEQNGEHPAAVLNDGKLISAFVRSDGGTRTVHLAAHDLSAFAKR